MTDSEPGLYERDLTPAEIEERKALNLDLQGERDQNLADIAQFRSQIRKLVATNKKLELHSAQVRHEIRSGKVLESRQVKINFGVELAEMSSEDPLDKLFPRPRTFEDLHTQLSVVLQGVLVPSIEKLEKCARAPSTGIFFAMSSWARSELARKNAKEHPDLKLPPATPMPVKLSELRAELQRVAEQHSKKKKRPAKPRPASGTPVRVRRQK